MTNLMFELRRSPRTLLERDGHPGPGAGHLAVVNNQVEIVAADIASGNPPWGHGTPRIYRDQFDEAVHALYNPPDNLGVPRFTATAHGGKLYARMGAAVTGRPQHAQSADGAGYLLPLIQRSIRGIQYLEVCTRSATDECQRHKTHP